MDAGTHPSESKADLFAELTSGDGERYRPYKWQTRLLGRFGDGDLPSAVDIPTGLGKTSVMALWLMALAAGADVPRRLVYVVDRRAVVDQATRFAERLRGNMSPSLGRRLGLGDRPLPISTLRGGFADNRDWLEDPSVPAIVVGTIDMVGSRLLFEGYGVSDGMRPYHAGFLGADTLLVLDEAHLCPPFEALLRDIAAHRDTKFGAIAGGPRVAAPPSFRLMSLSATSRTAPDAFRLEDEDREEPLVGQRLAARKRVRLIDIADPGDLPEELARRAVAFGFGAFHAGSGAAKVVVYCNGRQDAVKVKTLVDREIKARAKSAPDELEGVSELLVGERRVYERSRLEAWLEDNGFLGSTSARVRATSRQPDLFASSEAPVATSDSPRTAPAFLVATSAGEVGVDLDADHMVCDLVAYERMAQRLGRVNRRGGDGRSALVDVVAVRPPLKSGASKAQRAGHDELLARIDAQNAALTALPRGPDGRHDGSPSALVCLRATSAEVVERATTPAPLHPQLTRPCLESWAMTSLREHAGRPRSGAVAAWLGRRRRAQHRCRLAGLPAMSPHWRDKVSAPSSLVESYFQIAPIHATERLEAARSHVLDWLYKRVQDVGKRSLDHNSALRDGEIVALVLNRAGRLVRSASLADLTFLAQPPGRLGKAEAREQRRLKGEWSRDLAGATLVVDGRVGGLTDGMLDPKHDGEVPTADADQSWHDLREDDQTRRPVIRFRVQRLAGDSDGEGLPQAALDGWVHLHTFETDFGRAGAVEGGLAIFKWPDEPGDDGARSVSAKPQTLRDHAGQVAACVRQMVARLGLPAAEADALERAARWHDDGKAAPRWQDAMNAPRDDETPLCQDSRRGQLEIAGGLSARVRFLAPGGTGSLADRHAGSHPALDRRPPRQRPPRHCRGRLRGWSAVALEGQGG